MTWDFSVRKCRTCGKIGVGPAPTRLWKFEGWWYCREDWQTVLRWHESRGNIILAIRFELARASKKARGPRHDWMPYIHELCAMAGLALAHGDRQTFVHYAARAMQAWDLKQITDEEERDGR